MLRSENEFHIYQFSKRIIVHSARQKNKKSAIEIQLLYMNKNKSSNSRWPLYRENLISAPQKQTHAQSRKFHNIAHKKNDTASEKIVKSWSNFFGPIKKIDNSSESGFHGLF